MQLLAALAALAVVVSPVLGAVPQFGQCGGQASIQIFWLREADAECRVLNPFFFQCLTPSSTATTAPSGPSGTTTAPAPPSSGTNCPNRTKFKFFGVNESGAEFGQGKIPGVLGTDYIFPAPSSIDFFVAQGFNTFRVPFQMERMVSPSTGMTGALVSSYLGNYTATINYITNTKGAFAIIDPHNFMIYNGAQITNTASFQTFWTNLASQFRTNTRVIFDVMNEPNSMPATTVFALNQAAVNGIRAAGATSQLILVEGTSWTGAWTWVSSGNAAAFAGGIKDPNNNWAVQMHQYLDSDGSGTNPTCVSSTIGAERLAAATAWLKQTGFKGFLGEIGAGSNSACISAVQGAMCAMQQSGVWLGAAFWAAGPWWPADYFTSIEPPSGLAVSQILPQALKPCTLRASGIPQSTTTPIRCSQKRTETRSISKVSSRRLRAQRLPRTRRIRSRASRAVAQLSKIIDIGPEKTWAALKAAREKLPYDELCKRFMDQSVSGIQCILLDDGLGGVEELAEGIAWHDQFTSSASKRIVRVETVAEKILMAVFAHNPPFADMGSLAVFSSRFEATLRDCGADPAVVGFKSVACYRTGLDVASSADLENLAIGGDGFAMQKCLEDVHRMYQDAGKIRLAHKPLNDYVVRIALKISGECGKPIQFHTGLGDNDLSLTRASPAHLQSVIKAFPNTQFVLLHSAYPYTRDAGYLTAVYSNVWLDFGEVFPFVSAHGQRSIIHQVLELAPTNKILWSTDGHWWPESYYLGSRQARLALLEVLKEYVIRDELTEEEAIVIVQNALFHNSNRLYKLGLEPKLPENLQ
ncbi:CBM1 domain-containing protein [Mycena kentingensis (nom. inval.)]|nr:CBM1 domain-containing protein [Mycena kentingensis (nom. inval.)]